MKKRLLTFLPMLIAGQLWAQTPTETFSFNNGSFNGENGATATSSTASTTIADAKNNANSALSLNGSEQIVYNGLSLNPYNGLSVSFWVKPSSNMNENKNYVIFSQRTQCKAVHSIESFANNSSKKISFILRRTNGAVAAYADFTPDVWQHFTFTFNPTDGKMRAYKNGQYVDISTSNVEKGNIPKSISRSFGIGAHPCVGVDKYVGGFDELKIYGAPLEENDILGLFDESLIITSLSNTEKIEDLIIYPSPASSHIFIKGSVQIIDLNGNVLIDVESEGKVDVSSLSAGMYIVCKGNQKAKLIIE